MYEVDEETNVIDSIVNISVCQIHLWSVCDLKLREAIRRRPCATPPPPQVTCLKPDGQPITAGRFERRVKV